MIKNSQTNSENHFLVKCLIRLFRAISVGLITRINCIGIPFGLFDSYNAISFTLYIPKW